MAKAVILHLLVWLIVNYLVHAGINYYICISINAAMKRLIVAWFNAYFVEITWHTSNGGQTSCLVQLSMLSCTPTQTLQVTSSALGTFVKNIEEKTYSLNSAMIQQILKLLTTVFIAKMLRKTITFPNLNPLLYYILQDRCNILSNTE